LRAFWLVIVASLPIVTFDASAQQLPIAADTTVKYDSLGQIFSRRLTKISTPAYEHRRQILKELQRRGYANVLMDVVTFDGLSAFATYLKIKLQIEYSLLHTTLFAYFLVPHTGKQVAIPLPEDWSFPEDPWKKE
jgi:hypothetical protein